MCIIGVQTICSRRRKFCTTTARVSKLTLITAAEISCQLCAVCSCELYLSFSHSPKTTELGDTKYSAVCYVIRWLYAIETGASF
jgi:hypothetical protein